MRINWSNTSTTHTETAPMQQHPFYGAALKSLGRTVKWANLVKNGTTIGTAQVILRQSLVFGGLALLPRGPIWNKKSSREVRSSLSSILVQTLPVTGVKAFIINPETIDDWPALVSVGNVQIITPQHIAEIDLSTTETMRLESQTVKWRNRLRSAQKSNLMVSHHPFTNDPTHPIFTADSRQRRIKNFRALPHSFTFAYLRANPRAARLFCANLDGTIVAMMLFLLHGSVATYHIGWSDTIGRQTNAHNLLLWDACNWLANNGFTRLDLGTVDTESAPGLARFKIGSGAVVRPLGGTWLHTPLTAAPTRLMGRILTPRHHYHNNA